MYCVRYSRDDLKLNRFSCHVPLVRTQHTIAVVSILAFNYLQAQVDKALLCNDA